MTDDSQILFGQEPELPKKLSILIEVDRINEPDVINISECVDPDFDLKMMTEALATSVIVAAKYRESTTEKTLDGVIAMLKDIIFHGKIKP